ncbi:hypothetical protein [Krasilnikovia sp. M28-CT-15]|uniref:hypothetical protein n=1 Tax=Krasilnikovia sp. M28-CT-15 TaxID=3373540 RepID=UPI0038774FD7
MRKTKRIAGTIAAGAAGVAMLLGATAAPAQAASTIQGCPAGYVCLYPQNAGWNGGRPSYKWYTYGPHNLSNQFGTHRIFNNQVAGASARLCAGYNGTNCYSWTIAAGKYGDYNFTPVNSVMLAPSPLD